MSTYNDGYFGVPVCVGTEPSTFPFAKQGDPTTQVYSRTYEQEAASWAPVALGTVDPLRAGFYLIEETTPEKNVAGRLVFKRTYCNVSNVPRYKYGSTNFNRPSLHGVVYGGNRYVSFDGGVSSTKFTASKTTDFGGGGFIAGTGTFYNPANAVGLFVNNGASLPYYVGDRVALWDHVYGYLITTLVHKATRLNPFSFNPSKDPVLIEFTPADITKFDTSRVNYITGLGRDSSVNIANGAKICSARTKTTRILCGVTPGISTPSDISLSPGITTPYQWAAAMGATWASIGTVSVEDLGGGWIDVSTQELQVADALEVS